MNTIKQYLPIAAIVVAAVIAVFMIGHLLWVFAGAAALAAIVYFVPSIRTFVFTTVLGITPPTLGDLLAEFHDLVERLEGHAAAANAEAVQHRDNAANSERAARKAERAAAHAAHVAANVKNLVAAPAPSAPTAPTPPAV